MNKHKDISVVIAGEAGQGIHVPGNLVQKPQTEQEGEHKVCNENRVIKRRHVAAHIQRSQP